MIIDYRGGGAAFSSLGCKIAKWGSGYGEIFMVVPFPVRNPGGEGCAPSLVLSVLNNFPGAQLSSHFSPSILLTYFLSSLYGGKEL